MTATHSGFALECAKRALQALECRVCGQAGDQHKVAEIFLQSYKGSLAAIPVHRDDPIPGVSAPPYRQGALVCMLKCACQGGVLHVAKRPCGNIIVRKGDGDGPKDLGRDANAVNLEAGDACLLSQVHHLVTKIQSGERVIMSARLSCPEHCMRAQGRKARNV